ncbi:MAG: DUF547 domain-containing protein [Phycisphaerales bacterium]|nr:MAG: DUF547 domain-containing protein [Phycisphaerales bacterium]
MAERLVVIMAVVSIMLYVGGCAPAQNDRSGPASIDSADTGGNRDVNARIEPNEPVVAAPEPNRPEPSEVTPVVVVPDRPEPNGVKPADSEPDAPGPVETIIEKVETSEATSTEADPNEAELVVEPNLVTVDTVEPVETEPNEVGQAVAEPNRPDTAPSEPNIPPSVAAEPNEPEETKVEPDDVKVGRPGPDEPNEVRQTKGEPNNVPIVPDDVTSEAAEPNQVRPARVEPNEIVPRNVEPNDIDPTSIEPNDVNSPGPDPNDIKLDSATAFHEKCALLLKEYVRDNGTVDYATLHRKRLELIALLDEFDRLDPNVYESWPRKDKIALWINAYNVQMLKIITDNYPITPSRIRFWWNRNDIRHIGGIWSRYKFKVMDGVYRLSEIEDRFFRKEFGDPRVFFALTRASLSSPPIRREPYYGYKLDKQLDDQAKKFLASPLAFRIDKEREKVYLSALFQISMLGKDFIPRYGIDRKFKEQAPSTRAVLNFITNYVSGDVVSFLEVGNYSVQFIGYNWIINDGS